MSDDRGLAGDPLLLDMLICKLSGGCQPQACASHAHESNAAEVQPNAAYVAPAAGQAPELPGLFRLS